MQDHNAKAIIEAAIAKVEEMNPQQTDGKWLEVVTTESGPYIKEWDIRACWHWDKWPDREKHFRTATGLDVGIDAVAVRRSDGKHIAIQCKSRQLDKNMCGSQITKGEVRDFLNASIDPLWAERWIVTNGYNPLSSSVKQTVGLQKNKSIKLVNITGDLHKQREANAAPEPCDHCANPDSEEVIQTKSCMQAEAVKNSVHILREQQHSKSGGLPLGEARGRIILPCATGKTRISLRIVEELTPLGEVSIVLCPSIALVAQIRREYLQNADVPLDVLAVCSDETAGYNPNKEGSRNATADPTVDNSNVSADEVKGRVTTDAGEIAAWLAARFGRQIKVLIGTYQSSHKVSEALLEAGVRARVLIADEAHRTAGLKRKRSARSNQVTEEERCLRDFTICHDSDRFPVTYRIYQTATPRIYDVKKPTGNPDWIVRSMDDETTFGVELFRKSYVEAVRNGWLSDYRIIALGVNDPDAFKAANFLAKNTQSTGRSKLTTVDYLRGLAFALTMGGATQGGKVDIKSCIAFMNTVDKSKNMAEDLQSDNVKKWVAKWLSENADGRPVSDYHLEHLDASSNAAARDTAKSQLVKADLKKPHGIVNVGIFGEGTDSPSLSAVAFLEARKSPIDVVQAVGRAMRTAPGKELGYIICPILIPPSADPEKWLSASSPDEGWQELGQILLALRAHDQRIEDKLEDLLHLYIPKPPPVERSIVAVVAEGKAYIWYGEIEGPPGSAQEAVEQMLNGKSRAEAGVSCISETPKTPYKAGEPAPIRADDNKGEGGSEIRETSTTPYKTDEPTQLFTGKKNSDGSMDIRTDSVARDKPKSGAARGVVNIKNTKAKARKMINTGEGGIRLQPGGHKKPRKTAEERGRGSRGQLFIKLSGLEDHGKAIKMNLLRKSGLTEDRVIRDLNILESSVTEAARHLRADGLLPPLNRHFSLDTHKNTDKNPADGCTVAALLMMNAAMLHQRISAGKWLENIIDLAKIKNDPNVVRTILRQWNRISDHDFLPVLKPAIDVIQAIEDTAKLAGLERALHHLAAEAQRIAETYADMGADHAGVLFNRVMGNQASDGAYFTRPAAASMAARLTLDALPPADWTLESVWRQHKTVDLACGSGTLLAAMLAEMKRRARVQGASQQHLAKLQKIAVEDVLKGLDITPISLQLAASQLTAGNQQVHYRRMGLHLMPYGPNDGRVSVGTLELLGQKAIVARPGELNLPDEAIDTQATWQPADNANIENAIEAVKNPRIIIMNPPFTNRTKMGEKYKTETNIQEDLRKRTDAMEQNLITIDPEMKGFVDKSSIGPMFVALAERILNLSEGATTFIRPTIALTAPSGLNERRILAQRFHIHTILTSHDPGNVNMSYDTTINDSIIIICRRANGHAHAPTRFINLDKMPGNDEYVDEFYRDLQQIDRGLIPNGWGEVTFWPAQRIEDGDWTPAIWRSPQLAEAAWLYANHPQLKRLGDMTDIEVHATGPLLRSSFDASSPGIPGSFQILKSTSADGQTTITSTPDAYWIHKQHNEYPHTAEAATKKLRQKEGYLLITAGQRNNTSRLTAVASDNEYVGNGWMPVTGFTATEAKALAVFLNSTPGRLQIMRNPGRTLAFPQYSTTAAANIRIPDINDTRICDTLAACWEQTRDTLVPQFRDGDAIPPTADEEATPEPPPSPHASVPLGTLAIKHAHGVRGLWDEAVATALDWNTDSHIRGCAEGTAAIKGIHDARQILHREPHVRGLGYNQSP